jgi:hypothetical protein
VNRPRRPLNGAEIILPPATFVGGRETVVVKHGAGSAQQLSYGHAGMSGTGLELLGAPMRPIDRAVLIALLSTRSWSKVDYQAIREGNSWRLRLVGDMRCVQAKLVESGIVTIGLSISDIVDRTANLSPLLPDKLAAANLAATGMQIDKERAMEVLSASTRRNSYSIKNVRRSISNLKCLGAIIDEAYAGPEKVYYILNPYLYCNGPLFIRGALISHLDKRITGSVIRYSSDISQAQPVRRRKTNADLQHELVLKNTFIEKVARGQVSLGELQVEALTLVNGDLIPKGGWLTSRTTEHE